MATFIHALICGSMGALCLGEMSAAVADTPEIAAAISVRDYKKAIELQRKNGNILSGDAKAKAFKELAHLYLKDQDQEKAFYTFLQALEYVPACTEQSSGDPALYQAAFDLYIDPSNESPQDKAKKLIALLKPALQSNPKDFLLYYFVAIADANLNKFDEFFDDFFLAFTHFPEHYLAFKTKAVLHIKLLERTRGEEERNIQRRVIGRHFEEALKREPRDVTIYRLLISFSPKEEKEEQVRRSLNKIIGGNIMVPRSDLIFYVQEAVDSGERELAARFIHLAREWYPQSRLLESAQDYLDAHK